MSKKGAILVIDDDPGTLRLLERRLGADGYDVLTAQNGVLGLKRARAENPALIILDIMMPDMNGGEVAHQLAEDNETKDIPIVFLTITLSKRDKKEIEIDGRCYRAVSKPFHTPELLSAVKKSLREKHSGDSTPRPNSK